MTPHSTATVAVGGLQIRSGPGMDYPLLRPAEWKRRASGTKVTIHDALAEGDVVGVEGGAIAEDGQRWYLVSPFSSDGSYDAWVDPEDPGVGVDGWVPWVNEDSPTLVLDEVIHPPAVAWFGIGGADVDSASALNQAGLIWYAAAPMPQLDCHFKMTLPASGEVLVEDHVRGWGKGSAVWPDSVTEAQIDTTCAWAFDILEGVQ